jgi:hypothetical protein
MDDNTVKGHLQISSNERRGVSLDRQNTSVLEETMWTASRTAVHLNMHCSYN